eukprot:g1001.t1
MFEAAWDNLQGLETLTYVKTSQQIVERGGDYEVQKEDNKALLLLPVIMGPGTGVRDVALRLPLGVVESTQKAIQVFVLLAALASLLKSQRQLERLAIKKNKQDSTLAEGATNSGTVVEANSSTFPPSVTGKEIITHKETSMVFDISQLCFAMPNPEVMLSHDGTTSNRTAEHHTAQLSPQTIHHRYTRSIPQVGDIIYLDEYLAKRRVGSLVSCHLPVVDTTSAKTKGKYGNKRNNSHYYDNQFAATGKQSRSLNLGGKPTNAFVMLRQDVNALMICVPLPGVATQLKYEGMSSPLSNESTSRGKSETSSMNSSSSNNSASSTPPSSEDQAIAVVRTVLTLHLIQDYRVTVVDAQQNLYALHLTASERVVRPEQYLKQVHTKKAIATKQQDKDKNQNDNSVLSEEKNIAKDDNSATKEDTSASNSDTKTTMKDSNDQIPKTKTEKEEGREVLNKATTTTHRSLSKQVQLGQRIRSLQELRHAWEEQVQVDFRKMRREIFEMEQRQKLQHKNKRYHRGANSSLRNNHPLGSGPPGGRSAAGLGFAALFGAFTSSNNNNSTTTSNAIGANTGAQRRWTIDPGAGNKLSKTQTTSGGLIMPGPRSSSTGVGAGAVALNPPPPASRLLQGGNLKTRYGRQPNGGTTDLSELSLVQYTKSRFGEFEAHISALPYEPCSIPSTAMDTAIAAKELYQAIQNPHHDLTSSQNSPTKTATTIPSSTKPIEMQGRRTTSRDLARVSMDPLETVLDTDSFCDMVRFHIQLLLSQEGCRQMKNWLMLNSESARKTRINAIAFRLDVRPPSQEASAERERKDNTQENDSENQGTTGSSVGEQDAENDHGDSAQGKVMMEAAEFAAGGGSNYVVAPKPTLMTALEEEKGTKKTKTKTNKTASDDALHIQSELGTSTKNGKTSQGLRSGYRIIRNAWTAGGIETEVAKSAINNESTQARRRPSRAHK